MIGVGLSIGQQSWGGGVENTYDLLVSTDAEMQDVLDGTTGVSSDDVIALAPGVYDTASMSFTSQPSDVTWISQYSGSPAVVNNWNLRSSAGTGAITIRGINIRHTLPASGFEFWGPASATDNSIINADGAPFSDITLEDIDCDGGMARFLDGGRMTHDNAFLWARNVDNVTVRGCSIYNVMSGVKLDSVDGATIEDNAFYNFHADPIDLANSIGPCQNIVIRNNQGYDPGGTPSNFHSDFIQFQTIAASGYDFANIEIYGNRVAFGTKTPVCQVDPSHVHLQFTGGETAIAAGDIITGATSGATAVALFDAVVQSGSWGGSDAAGFVQIAQYSPTFSASENLQVSASTVAVMDVTGTSVLATKYTGSFTVETSHHTKEIRILPSGAMTVTMPSAVGNKGEQYNCRYSSGGTGTVSFALDGADTYDGGSAPSMTTEGNSATFVSDGSGNWDVLSGGYRAWWLARDYDFTAGDLEDTFVTMLDARSGDVTMTLPVSGSRTFHLQRVDNSENSVTLAAGSGDSISLHGSSDSTVAITPGYGLTVTRSDDGDWTATEEPLTLSFLFANGNDDNWSSIEIYGNVANIPGAAIRIEDEVTDFLVYNNTFIPLIMSDQNGDGVIGIYEAVDANQLSELSGTGIVQNNLFCGILDLGADGAAVPDAGNDVLSISDTDPIPSSITARFIPTTRVGYEAATGADLLNVALAKASGPLDGTFIGALGTTISNGYYDFAAGEVNASATLPDPLLLSSTPVDEATEIGVGATITLTFNQVVEAGTGNITLRAGGSAVEAFNVATGSGDNGGSVAFSGKTVTVTPGADMALSTAHAIQVASTAIVGTIYQTAFDGIADDTTLNFTTVASSLSFASAITDSANNSLDMRYTATVDGAVALISRDGYEWMTTGGASDEQVIDTTFSDDMLTATKTALHASGSFVVVSDIRYPSAVTSGSFTLQARGFVGTTFNDSESLNIATGNWLATPSGFWDHVGYADVSALYSLSAGTVYRVWLVWSQDGTNTRVQSISNDGALPIEWRRHCIFDRATFDASDATMDTEIAALAP